MTNAVFNLSLSRFATVGILNTGVGLAVIYGCKAAGLSDVHSNLLGYVFGMGFGFFLNKRWTFRHSGQYLPALARYVMVLLLAYTANLLAVIYAIEVLNMNSYLGQAVGIFPYFIATYFGCRFFAFRGSVQSA